MSKKTETSVSSETLARSETFENVKAAFKDQMRAHAIYNLMARIAEKEDNRLVRKIYRETAKQELTHAEVLGEFLQTEDRTSTVPVECAFPVQNTTEGNLEGSISAEHEDRDSYKKYAKIARKEGFDELGYIFEGLSEAENYHGARFDTLLRILDRSFEEDAHGWRCLKCGWVSDPERPSGCQVCESGENYFMPLGFEDAINSMLSGKE